MPLSYMFLGWFQIHLALHTGWDSSFYNPINKLLELQLKSIRSDHKLIWLEEIINFYREWSIYRGPLGDVCRSFSFHELNEAEHGILPLQIVCAANTFTSIPNDRSQLHNELTIFIKNLVVWNVVFHMIISQNANDQ